MLAVYMSLVSSTTCYSSSSQARILSLHSSMQSIFINPIYSILVLVPIFFFSTAQASESNLQVHLTPIHLSVTEKEAAIFYCSLNCSSDHSLLWLVGEPEASHLQPFTATSASMFRDKTGIHVEVKDQSTCNDNKGKKQQVLTIHSSILHPMLLIRCVAQPITPNFSDAKSNYATLRVHPVTDSPTTSLPVTTASANTETMEILEGGKLPQISGTRPSFVTSSWLLLSLLFLSLSCITNYWLTTSCCLTG